MKPRYLMTVLAAVCLSTLASGAVGQTPPASTGPEVVDGVIVNPNWTRLAQARTVERVLSRERPVVSGTRATATLICTLSAELAPRDCSIATETPVGVDVGTSAISIFAGYRHAPTLDDGRSAQGMKVRQVVTWLWP